MYRDDDGVATTQSQVLYDARMRLLLILTCILSFVGYGAAVANGDYAIENLRFPSPLKISDLLEYGKWLWVRRRIERTAIPCAIETDLYHSPSFHYTALAFTGKVILLKSIQPG